MSNVMNTPIEVAETEYPLRVEEYTLRPGSAGAGASGGGLGLRRAYRILADDAQVTTMIERAVVAPWGLAGGTPGEPYRITLERDGRAHQVKGKETLVFHRGDCSSSSPAAAAGSVPPSSGIRRSSKLIGQRDTFDPE